jgi:hypothetical protein
LYNHWIICREVLRCDDPPAGNPREDVKIAATSAYYEPVDMPDCSDCNFPDVDEDCRPNPVTECDCADEEGDSGCYNRHM